MVYYDRRNELARAFAQVSTQDSDNSQTTHVAKEGESSELVCAVRDTEQYRFADHAVRISSRTVMHVPVFSHLAHAW